MINKAKHAWFNTVPKSVRKPLVLIVGSLFIIGAAATGWLPGPGGIPLFLLGIAILATEFVWAERLRDRTLAVIHYVGRQWREHMLVGTAIFVCCVVLAVSVAVYSLGKL